MPRNENDLLRWGDIENALYNYHKSTPANRAFGMAEIRAVLHELEFVEKVDPESLRPKGEWIEDGYAEKPCVCSYCGEEAHYTSTFRETFDYDWEENLQSTGYEEIREYVKSNFCPNCGADMRGENDA